MIGDTVLIHGERFSRVLPRMNCGGTPVFDTDSEFSYRCDMCFAVVGSVGQPSQCKEINGETQ